MTVVDTLSSTYDAIQTALRDYASSHHDGIIALLLFLGVVITFSGRVMLKPTVFLLGFLPTVAAISALVLAFAEDQGVSATRLRLIEGISLVFASLMGSLVGVVVLRLLFRVATFIICAGFGAVTVFVLHLFLLEPATGPNSQFFLYCLAVIAALLAGLFSVTYPETGVIFGTAFDGAALAVFSLARFLGHRPHVLSDNVTADDTSSPWWAVAYGASTLVLALFGAITQHQVATADRLVAERGGVLPVVEEGTAAAGSGVSNGVEVDPLLATPRTPPSRSGFISPGGNSAYGAIADDTHYNVMQNLGAAPLGSTIESFKSGKDVNGPLPL